MALNTNRTGRHRKPAKIHAVYVLAAVALLVATIVLALAACTAAGSPRACRNPALPSGDAMRAPGGQEYVCTDGTWVKVTGYGNP